MGSLAFLDKGKTLVDVGDDGIVRLSEVETGKPLRQFTGPAHGCWLVRSGDGKRLAGLGAATNEVYVWDVNSGREVGRLVGRRPLREVVSVGFSTDGKALAAGYEQGQGLCLWDVATNSLVNRLRADAVDIEPAAFSPDGKILAFGGAGKAVRFWDLATGKEDRAIDGPGGPVLAGFYSPDGRIMVSHAPEYSILWEAVTGKELCRIGYSWALALSPDGKTLAWSLGQQIRIASTASGQEAFHFQGHSLPIDGVAYSPDDRSVVTTGGRAWIWETATAKGRPVGGESLSATCAAFSRTGQLLALGCSKQQSIQLWDLVANKEIRRFTGRPGEVEFIASQPRDGTVVSMSRHQLTKQANNWTWTREQGVRVWDAGSGKEVRQVGNMMMDCIALSTDGKLLASGQNWINLWDMTSGKNLGRLPGDLSFIYALAFSPDASRLAASSYNQIRKHYELTIWDLNSRQPQNRLAWPENAILAVNFSPDSRILASAGSNGTISLWEVESGKEMWQFRGHRGRVLGLAFSANGKQLVSGSSDTTALIWDAWGFLLPDQAKVERLEPGELAAVWSELAGEDGRKAYLAMRTLARSPIQTVPFLGDRLRAHPKVEPGRVARWIADLDNDKFAIRERAEAELARLGCLVEPSLRQTLQGQPSTEARHRLNRLLDRLAGKTLPPEQLRGLRALTVLEQIGSPQAQQLLQALVNSDLGPRLTQEARSSLARLRVNPAANR